MEMHGKFAMKNGDVKCLPSHQVTGIRCMENMITFMDCNDLQSKE